MIVKELKTGESMIKAPISDALKCGYVLLKPGEEIGEHKTENKEEVIIILSGLATIICDGETEKVGKEKIVYIPPEKLHNIKNEGDEELRYLYVVCLKK